MKDKNGKEIYEGDILAIKNDDNKIDIVGVVEYGVFNCTCCEGVYGWYLDRGDIRDVDLLFVIGNVFDNPELLKEGE